MTTGMIGVHFNGLGPRMDAVSSLTSSQLTDRQLIDADIWLASMASDRQAVDPIMDKVRQVTAGWEPSQPLTPEQRSQLLAVREKIEDYLVSADPVRTFTEQDLRQRLARHLGLGVRRVWWQEDRWALAVILIAATLMGALPVVVPNAFDITTRISAIFSLFFFVIHTGSSWLFLTALSNFKTQLKRAFGVLAIGLMLVSVAGAQLPLISIYGLDNSPWFTYTGFLPIFTVAHVCIFVGLAIFARQLDIQRKWLSWRRILGLGLVAGLVTLVAPHAPLTTAWGYYELSSLSLAWSTLYVGWAAVLAFRIAGHVTPTYGAAMKLLGSSLSISTGTLLMNFVGIAVVGSGLKGPIVALTLAPFIVGETLLLLSGYTFKKRVNA